jgi:rhodanese-related sulfurtransferase
MKKFARAFTLAAAVAAFAAPSVALAKDVSSTENKDAFGRLTIDQVNELIAKKDGFIFDNNSKETYAKGHVPTAKWVAFNDLSAADLPASKDAKLVFYCGDERCGACHVAARTAIELGYKNVFIMPAGIAGWQKAKQKLEA